MPDMAIVCLSKLVMEGFNIVGVVPPHRSEDTYSLMCSITKSMHIPIIEYANNLDEIDFLHKVRQINADIAVVCSYNKKFPPELLKCVKGGFVNCHPSLLPDYRGANPYSNVIINDEKMTGITLHFMDENFDTGNIIAQKKVPLEWITPDGTGLTQDYIDYALPLIQGDCKAPLEDGLPRFAKLKKILVEKK